MKTAFVGAPLLALLACSTAPVRKIPAASERVDPSGRAPARVDPAAEAEFLLNSFEKAVTAHDTGKVLEFLDPHYRGKEYEDLYQKNSGAFLNDFFCGKVVKGEHIYCLKFSEIMEIHRMGTESFQDEILAHYIVKSTSHEIRTKVTVAVRKTYSFGIIGSKGYTQVE